MARVLVVVNKFWECDAMMAALLNETVRAPGFGWPVEVYQPRLRGAQWPAKPRALYVGERHSVEVWCVSDVLEHSRNDLQSSTEEKSKVVAPMWKGNSIDLLVAVGTAGFPVENVNYNGCVVVGTNVFVHDGHPAGDPNELSKWHDGPFDEVIPSTLSEERFVKLTSFDAASLAKSFVKAPNNPSPNPAPILMDRSFVSLGTVNVTDYHEYKTKDGETVKAFDDIGSRLRAGSLETTHGLLRRLGSGNFLFVSGITDRLGHFDDEVNVGQNFAASFNAGLVVSGILSQLGDAF